MMRLKLITTAKMSKITWRTEGIVDMSNKRTSES
jgi:hypothetical protein